DLPLLNTSEIRGTMSAKMLAGGAYPAYLKARLATFYENVVALLLFNASEKLSFSLRLRHVIGLKLPIQVEVKVVEVDPGLKGDTS
ncbi:hypothetical protein Tco_0927959, partial [Tanacetum coccineum]